MTRDLLDITDLDAAEIAAILALAETPIPTWEAPPPDSEAA